MLRRCPVGDFPMTERVVLRLTFVLQAGGLGCENGAAIRHADVGDASEESNRDAPRPCSERDPRDASTLDVEAGEDCGVQMETGGYLGPCDLAFAEGGHSTLCDEEAGRCVAPQQRCCDGWCYIPARSYLSGASPDMLSHFDRQDAAISVVSRAFHVAETETTLDEFRRLMGYAPSGTTGCGGNCPVAGVSLFEAMEFANRLSRESGLEECYELEGCGVESFYHPAGSGLHHESWMCEQSTFAGAECTGYRLPSRAEWELAGRAGSVGCLPRGASVPIECGQSDAQLLARAIYCGNSDAGYRPCVMEISYDGSPPKCVGPVPVRSTLPNDFGVYEVLGNVLELTQTHATLRSPDSQPVDTDAPFDFVQGPEFAMVLSKGDLVYGMGGYFATSGSGICGASSLPTLQSFNEMELQTTGFRLVRTAQGKASR